MELSDHCVDVIFTIFDEDGDGQLSNKVCYRVEEGFIHGFNVILNSLNISFNEPLKILLIIYLSVMSLICRNLFPL